MRQRETFIEEGHEDLVCKLKRSLYGLERAPRCWNSELASILRHFDMEDVKVVKSPDNTTLKLIKADDQSECVDVETYQPAVGKLLYLSTHTRPDIAFAVSVLPI